MTTVMSNLELAASQCGLALRARRSPENMKAGTVRIDCDGTTRVVKLNNCARITKALRAMPDDPLMIVRTTT